MWGKNAVLITNFLFATEFNTLAKTAQKKRNKLQFQQNKVLPRSATYTTQDFIKIKYNK